ncbi:MAG: hypothetical protein ACI4IV_01505 [Acutalibacteraceae bacterium]
MHAGTEKYNELIAAGQYKLAWEFEFVPNGARIEDQPQPQFFHAVKSGYDGLYRAQGDAVTVFSCNTNRNGAMYFHTNPITDKAARSSKLSDENGIFTTNQKLSFHVVLSGGDAPAYTEFGFSSRCQNGDFAVEFAVQCFGTDPDTGEDKYLVDHVQNNTDPVYRMKDLGALNCEYIAVTIVKWSAPKTRAVISRLFFGEMSFVINNDAIVKLPNTLKELESDNSNGIGTPSSNQLSFSFFNLYDLPPAAYSEGAKIYARTGIKTEEFEELFPGGEYIVKSASEEKGVVGISAQDDLSSRLSGKLGNFNEAEYDSAKRTYFDFIKKMFPDVLGDFAANESGDYIRVMTVDKGLRPLRGASVADQVNEFCTVSGTCLCYDDSGDLRVFQRIGDSTVITVGEDRIISCKKTLRKMPDVVEVQSYSCRWLTSSADSRFECYKSADFKYPDFSAVGSGVYTAAVDYKDADKKIYLKLHGKDAPAGAADTCYATNAVFRRRLYDSDGNKIDQGFDVTAEECIEFVDVPNVRRKRYANGKNVFSIKSYLITGIAGYGDAVEDGDLDWIYNWFRRTRVERTFEIMSDPRIELGDTVAVCNSDQKADIVGTVYRIESDGVKTKLTIRSEE